MRRRLPDELADALGDATDAFAGARIARDLLIVTCWRAGAGLCEIAEHCDVSHETVRRIIAKQMADAS